MLGKAVALCTLLLLACASAGVPHETGSTSRSLLQLYTEEELQQEVELVKQHIAKLQQQLLTDNRAASNVHLDDAAERTTPDQDTSSSLATAAQMMPVDTDIFTFDLTQDQQAPPVDLSQRRAGLLRILSRIAETDPHLVYTATPYSTSGSTSSGSSSGSYLPESAPVLGPGYSHMTGKNLFKDADSTDQVKAQLSLLLAKLNGRGPRLGVKESQFIPRTESAVLAPLADQANSEANRQGNSEGEKVPDDDASPTNAQLVSLLSRVNGIVGNIVKTAADNELKPPRSEAKQLAGSAEVYEDAADTAGGPPSEASRKEELQKGAASNTAVQDTSMSGKGPYYGSISVVPASGSVKLAEPNEIHAEPTLRVKVLNPVTIAAPPGVEAMSFQDIQQTASDVAAAVAAESGSSKSSSSSSNSNSAAHADREKMTFIIPVTSAAAAGGRAPRANVQAPGKQALGAGAVTGIAVSAFIAVLLAAGIILMWQARQIRKEVDSGYTKTAQSEDVELACKPSAVCVSPAISVGGAAPSTGGALPSIGAAANCQGLLARTTARGQRDSPTHTSSSALLASGTKATGSGGVFTLE